MAEVDWFYFGKDDGIPTMKCGRLVFRWRPKSWNLWWPWQRLKENQLWYATAKWFGLNTPAFRWWVIGPLEIRWWINYKP